MTLGAGCFGTYSASASPQLLLVPLDQALGWTSVYLDAGAAHRVRLASRDGVLEYSLLAGDCGLGR